MARKHKTCSKCNAEQKSNRAASCYKCGAAFPSKSTVVKKLGRPTNYEKKQRGERIVAAAPRNDKRKNNDYDGIILKLLNAKSEYQQKLSEIDSAIEVLKKYAA